MSKMQVGADMADMVNYVTGPSYEHLPSLPTSGRPILQNSARIPTLDLEDSQGNAIGEERFLLYHRHRQRYARKMKGER